MSHNLVLGNFPLRQTTTEFTWRVLSSGMGRYQIAELYYYEYLLSQVPILRGADLTNPYKIAEVQCAQTEADAAYESLLAYLKHYPNVSWGST